MTQGRILLVEDDSKMRYLLQSQLKQHGYNVQDAQDGEQALMIAAQEEFDLVLLDISLPGIDGMQVGRQIREWSSVPIILLTGTDTPQMKMTALEQCADDYVTKPFHTGELLARIRAVLRRSRAGGAHSSAPEVVQVDDMIIDLSHHELRRGAEMVHLTKIEFSLLRELVSHADKLLTYEQLIIAVWGSGYDDVRPLHVHMCNLRRKLQPGAAGPRRILAVPGVGYRFRLHDCANS